MAFIKTRKKIVSSAIVSSLSVMAGNAIAQDQVTQLETIRAQAETEQTLKVDQSANSKFVAPLLDTPKSVSVISKQLIADTQVTTLSDALRTVPGITLGAGEGGNPNGDRPFIRGYNSESSMYVDGVRSATSQNREMFAVEQVEVSKGSSSTQSGSANAGGSINMISKVAKKGDSLEGSVGAGTDNYQRITLDGNKDFGNGIAARVAVMGHHNEKAGQADGAEYARFGIAPSITFGLDTDTRATLSYYYLKTDDTPDAGVPFSYNRTADRTEGKPIDVKQGIYYGWKDRDFQKQENQIGTLKLEHDLNENLTLSNTAVFSQSKNNYVWTQPDDSKGNVLNSNQVWRRANTRITDTTAFTDQLSLAGKFNTGTINHSFNSGIEYSKQESDKGSYSVVNSKGQSGGGYSTGKRGCNGTTTVSSEYWCVDANNPNSNDPWLGSITAIPKASTTTTENTSVYFLDSIALAPKWILDLGVRWDQFESEVVTHTPGTAPVSNDEDFVNYQVGLVYKPVENGSIYASYSTASNPSDFGDGSESLSAAIQDLKAEEVRTMELGTKWDLFNNRANATAAIFRTEKTNTRVTADNGTTQNIGETSVDGIELGLNGNITDKWAASLAYTYLDAEIVDGGFVSGSPTGSVNGNQTPTTAKHSASLWTTYDVLPNVTVGGGAFYSDKVYADNTNFRYAPSYVRYDLMARYNVNKNVDLQLNVNNVTDERYFTKVSSPHYTTEAEGRSAVLSLNFKY